MAREGPKNGRWIEKVPYACPCCGKVLMLTPRKGEKYTARKTTCSKKCMGEMRRGKKRGPNPEASKRMRENNPMWQPDVAAKASATLRSRYEAGELEVQREAQRERGRIRVVRLIEHNKTEEAREKTRQRMIESNPMRRPEVAEKVSRVHKEQFASGKRVPPWKGRTKPDAVARMSSDRNPMKDPETRKATLRKIIASHQKNGISQGERNVRDALESLSLNYIQQFMVDGPRQSYFLDFYLPDLRCCIEYDGHSHHYTEEGEAKDKERDAYIRNTVGARTIRIHRDTAYIGIDALAAVIAKGLENEDHEHHGQDGRISRL